MGDAEPISERLGNVSPSELTDALAALRAEGIVERRIIETATKPREEWRTVAFATSHNGFSHWDNSDYSTIHPDRPNSPNGIFTNDVTERPGRSHPALSGAVAAHRHGRLGGDRMTVDELLVALGENGTRILLDETGLSLRIRGGCPSPELLEAVEGV